MDTLDQLATLTGIEPGYHDIWGHYRETSRDTKACFLKAMGYPVGTPDDCAESLARFEIRTWRRLVDPVVLVPAEAQPGTVAVTVPAGLADRALSWTLVEEGGREHGSRIACRLLPVTEMRHIDAGDHERRAMSLPEGLPDGYHCLTVSIEGTDLTAEATVVVAPRRCWTLEDVAPGERLWGLSCQLYALRSGYDWGIGNFSALGSLAEQAASAGADAVGLNPLHALFPADPGRYSPYSPSSREFLNILYIDVEAIPDFAESEAAQQRVAATDFVRRLKEAREAALVSYDDVAALMFPTLWQAFESFRRRHLLPQSDRARAFRAFQESGGEGLRRFAVFHALQAHFSAEDKALWAWDRWPEGYRQPDSEAVATFTADHREQVEFHEYLQWIADEQLHAAADRGRAAGLRVGLYRDLAVGLSWESASVWSNPGAFVTGVSIGAPPDLLNHLGQSWGLMPLNPLTLREQAYGPIIDALRSNMRHAGAIRIDHVMGLMHLYWVPAGHHARDGAYVAYPFDDLMRIVALESHRAKCVVIGEDLGTVPDGFRPAMAAAGVLSYRVLQFERVGDRLFKRSQDYPAAALVTAGTHDTPTLAGFWYGADLAWRQRLGLYPSLEMTEQDAADRIGDRRRLIDALIDAGLWREGGPRPGGAGPPDLDDELVLSVHRFLSGTPSRIMMVQIEDLVGQVEQQNLPGTIDEHPNWRRRMPDDTPSIFADPKVISLLAAVADARRGRV